MRNWPHHCDDNGTRKWKKTWTYRFNGTEIIVMSTPASGCALYVNGKLQDKGYPSSMGFDMGHLHGRSDGGEEIKAKVYVVLIARCSLFVNDEEIEPQSIVRSMGRICSSSYRNG